MTRPSGVHWYVVHTHPHAEAKAEAHLRRQGFKTYLPRYRRSLRHARRSEVVFAPLFPRYIFVAMDTARQRWRAIQSTLGVSRLVSFGETPATLKDRVIEQIKSQETEDGLVRIPQRSAFAPGERIRVCNGPLESCLGLFEDITDNERVTVLLDLLGRRARVILNLSSVAAT
jgi:transcriptional antiterminator RfaH